MSTHAKLGPSGAAGWMTCVGWESDSGTNIHAQMGSIAHAALEMALNNGMVESDLIGCEMELEDGFKYTVDAEMAAHIGMCIDLVDNLQLAGPTTIDVEVALPIGHLNGEAGSVGTADVLLHQEGELIVIDFKYGMVPVEVVDNPQLKMYAAAALGLYDPLIFGIDTVRTFIVQPRGRGVSEYSYSVDEIEDFAQEIRDAAERHGNPSIARTPGVKQCTWCKHKTDCQALADFTHESVAMQFDDLSAQMLGDAFARVELTELWCKSVRAKAETELTEGRSVPGLKLVAGRRGNRKWTDERDVSAALMVAGLSDELIFTKSVNSPAAFDKLVKAKKVDAAVLESVANLITQADATPTVALISDARPALPTFQPEI